MGKTERGRIASERVMQLRMAKEQAAARVEAAVHAVEVAQKALESAIAADLEATNALQEATQEHIKIDQEDRIQKVIAEREEARRAKNFKLGDQLRDELRSMGVTVNDADKIWTGPNGLTGQINDRRPGDWDCPQCGLLNFARKEVCFKCGASKEGGSGRDRGRDRGGYEGRGG